MTTKKIDTYLPGYTGHIPKSHFDKIPPTMPTQYEGFIPGYSGYVHKVKPENCFGKSFGQITLQVNNLDHKLDQQFLSTNQVNFIDQNQIKSKKASEIVGVDFKPTEYLKPTDAQLEGLSNVARIEKENQQLDTPQQTLPIHFDNIKFIEKSLSGYTGHNRGVYADNVYGCGYKKAQELAVVAKDERMRRVQEKISEKEMEQPPIFVSKRITEK